MMHNDLFVGGELVDAYSSARIQVTNPATEKVIGSIVDADERDVRRAVDAAQHALRHSPWTGFTPKERALHLEALADAIERRTEDLASLVTAQNGMPISLSRASNGKRLADTYRYFASLIDSFPWEEVRSVSGGHALVRQEPVGVAALIAAWNGPQGLIAWKLGPALAAGNTVVIKPAPETTLDAYLLAEAVQEAGFPPGVVNIITGGRETGAMLVADPGVRKVAFTGSSEAGRRIAGVCGQALKRVTLELGGKSAAVLLEDVDMEAFVPFVTSACSPNTGQTCRALTRILTPQSRYDETVDAVAGAMREARTGDPLDPATVFGPLVSERQRERVEGYIRSGQEEGARLVMGGGRPAGLPVGYYLNATVFADVDNGMRIAREEIFGPVLCVIPYRDEEEAVRLANDSDYGLGGGIFTSDPAHGADVARRLETGTVGVNSSKLPVEVPFGGVKGSGIGRELGPESLRAYVETKSIFGGNESNSLV